MRPNRRETIPLLAVAAPAAIGMLSAAGTANPAHAQEARPRDHNLSQKIETRIGTLEFTLQGKPYTLGAFVEDGTEQIQNLFVPFADMTTGTETYSAGRYLDLQPTATGYYTIDFNRAYNPYCAYNSTYECPFPPLSNRLKLPIRAGEKAPGA